MQRLASAASSSSGVSGRLTLNILLSFAQFEREIIGERTRDKMTAARRTARSLRSVLTRNLTVTYGLRWEDNSAPSSPNGTLPFTVIGVENLATMTLAPAGTPLWKAQKDDFAPRLGLAWQPVPLVAARTLRA
jgi:hypothetical protein